MAEKHEEIKAKAESSSCSAPALPPCTGTCRDNPWMTRKWCHCWAGMDLVWGQELLLGGESSPDPDLLLISLS